MDAKEALQKLRGQDDPAVPDESTAGMLDGVSVESVEDLDASSSTTAVAPEEVKRDHEIRPVGLWEAMNSPELRRCFMAALGLHAAQQFSGINAAIFYSVGSYFRRCGSILPAFSHASLSSDRQPSFSRVIRQRRQSSLRS